MVPKRKTLKFREHLVKEIQAGRKTATWRLFDDKNLSLGDEIDLLYWETKEKFAEAKITRVREKSLREIEEADYDGHEKFESKEAMLASYKQYYGEQVTDNTRVKLIDFEILRFF